MKITQTIKLLLLTILLVACKDKTEQQPSFESNETVESKNIEIKYAKGFEITPINKGYHLTITKPWPDAKKSYTYTLLNDTDASIIDSGEQIHIPVNRLIATSTTHIPPLVLLEEASSLIGFPSTNYISSPEIRTLIDQGKITDLGIDNNMDVESILLTNPDLIMGYGVTEENMVYQKVQQAGIPVLYNGDWTESHPLGKAEWIKVYGVLFDKVDAANAIFIKIEKEYLAAQKLASNRDKPKVLAGASWKDTWYLPYGDSWQGKILKDAGADYIYAQSTGSGSLAYNIEKVLTDAQDADYWIAPAQYTSYSKMSEDQAAYEQFKAFVNKQVYTFALNKGIEGGVIYYEEASMRPDLVLKDLIKILHPELKLDHELYFFDHLED
ncbi:MAG: ABC transporter substrate-binding protein [Nonlabens sp.]